MSASLERIGPVTGRRRARELVLPWVGIALALHAALVGLAYRVAREAPAAARHGSGPGSGVGSIEIELLAAAPPSRGGPEAPPRGEPRPVPPQGGEAGDAGSRRDAPAGQGGAARRLGGEGAPGRSERVLARSSLDAIERAQPRGRVASEAARLEAAPTSSTPLPEAAPLEPAAPDRRLSLSQLGVGEHNPFRGLVAARRARANPSAGAEARRAASAGAPRGATEARRGQGGEPPIRDGSSARRAGRQLDRYFRRELARADQRGGLGADHVLRSGIERLAYADAELVNTGARLRVTTDGEGRVATVEVLMAKATDLGRWRALAQKLKEELGRGVLAGVAGAARNAAYTLQVRSRVALPSGRDPGFAVDLFGIPLVEGDGPKSSRLSIFGLAGFIGLGADFDLVDIDAVARKVVHSHVLAFEVDPPDRAAAAAPVRPSGGE